MKTQHTVPALRAAELLEKEWPALRRAIQKQIVYNHDEITSELRSLFFEKIISNPAREWPDPRFHLAYYHKTMWNLYMQFLRNTEARRTKELKSQQIQGLNIRPDSDFEVGVGDMPAPQNILQFGPGESLFDASTPEQMLDRIKPLILAAAGPTNRDLVWEWVVQGCPRPAHFAREKNMHPGTLRAALFRTLAVLKDRGVTQQVLLDMAAGLVPAAQFTTTPVPKSGRPRRVDQTG